jgi:NADPH:quinone reductase-like Zn-dependent oxidoreductase
MFGAVLRSRSQEEKIVVAREFSKAVLPFLCSECIRLVVDRVFRFDEIAEAPRHMEANASFGKIVLTC